MLKTYFGENRAKNLDWLSNTWLKDGPPVCFLQGFSGVGKSDLARDFKSAAEKQLGTDGKPRWRVVIEEIADRATPSVLESLMELSINLSQQGLPEMAKVLFEQANPNLAFALEKALQRPVIIILDEAQRFFQANKAAPLPEMNGILSFLRNRPDLPGRLLLLSDREVEKARWSEWIPKRTLEKLSESEAIAALEAKLREAQVDADIPEPRKPELVRDLDFNPRAIEALVGALRHETLDDIIASTPGLWDVHDREVSPDFLKALERDLLERTLSHLAPEYQQKLWRLAVHRRHFRREALEKLCANKAEASELREALVSRYLLNFYQSALSLNPIVREISLAHLREDSSDYKKAHAAAADYHGRHFAAKEIVDSQSKLSGAFAELRYHLVQAGKEQELRSFNHRYTDHLKQQIKAVTPVPIDSEELDERIGVLAVLLENGGAKGLEYHLARCLQRRNRSGDSARALVHGRRALDNNKADTWILVAKLLVSHGEAHSAIELLMEGIECVPESSDLFALYQYCAELLTSNNQLSEAIAILRRGLLRIPPDKNLFALYQSCAELLAREGKADEAVSLLKDSIRRIPPDKGLSSLYQSCAELLAHEGKTDEAVSLLKDGIQRIPTDKNLFALYQSCAELLAHEGKTDEAVSLLKDGIQRIPADKSLTSLYQSCAELLAHEGKTDEAVSLLKDGIQRIPADKGLFSLYQSLGELYCQMGDMDQAIASQEAGFGKMPSQFGGYKLAEGALFLSAGSGREQALTTLLGRTGTEALSAQPQALGQILLCQLQDDWQSAATIAARARHQFPRYFPLAVHESLAHLGMGKPEAAWQSLSSFANLRFDAGASHGWLAAFIHLRRQCPEEAKAALEVYLERPVKPPEELSEAFLLRLWDGQEAGEDCHTLAFHFPVLPGSMTGLDRPVYRVQFAPPVLAIATTTPVKPLATASLPVNTEALQPKVYVSYAWGEDTTEAGRQREEIVDLLCATLAEKGIPVGRDKERMKGGDSIERFAQEISKAKHIVAVVSAKSLQSEFCMAHELFRAYRRCDYQRGEFQEKVIALVMDDALPLLNNNLALIDLAGQWQTRLEELRSKLEKVDPRRKSPNLWVFVDLVEEMCPRLPDLLSALSDIVMKRGFEEIEQDKFQEVIQRLQ